MPDTCPTCGNPFAAHPAPETLYADGTPEHAAVLDALDKNRLAAAAAASSASSSAPQP